MTWLPFCCESNCLGATSGAGLNSETLGILGGLRVAESFVIGPEDVAHAARQLEGHVLRTPLIPSEALSRVLGCSVYLKAENLQQTGSFKARGATNAVLSLAPDCAERGVVTHSSGNHAAALARAARMRGVPAHIVMPSNSSPVKLAAVRGYGIEPVLCGVTSEERAAVCENVRASTGATLIHPYETPQVIAGQATVAAEMIEQANDLAAVFCPVGGGGLLAGTLISVKHMQPSVRVIAAEPAWADDTARSLRSGRWEQPTRYDSIADGLRTAVGQHTLPIIRHLLDDIILVSESEILTAMRILAERAHLVVEPSGAVAFAGLMQSAENFSGLSVGVILSGGNLNMNNCRLGTPSH